jgi:hypothetical protein
MGLDDKSAIHAKESAQGLRVDWWNTIFLLKSSVKKLAITGDRGVPTSVLQFICKLASEIEVQGGQDMAEKP